jgi:hypothetical protein
MGSKPCCARGWHANAGGNHFPLDNPEREGMQMLLALAIVLFIIAIAGGVIIHPIIFVLALVALVMFFSSRRGARI